MTEISNAKNALNGQETDKSELEALVKEAPEVKEANKNASTKAKEAYDEAIQAGQDVLDNSDATQSEVNEAKEKIEEAKRNLANEIKTLAEKLNVEVTKTEVGDK
nr:YSIRK signal domain/LPXTG anchor domain surface protein [Lactobacillus mulieris]